MSEPTRICSLCCVPLPLSVFGIDRARKDGLNLCCKPCVRNRMAAVRQRNKERLAKIVELKGQREFLFAEAAKSKVVSAVAQGHHTREAIRSYTRMSMEIVCDALAELTLEQGTLRVRQINGEKLFVRAA